MNDVKLNIGMLTLMNGAQPDEAVSDRITDHTAVLSENIGEEEKNISAKSEIQDSEEIKRNKRNARKSFIKLVAISVSVIIIIIIGTIAWFTMNREVETTGMGVKTTEMPFEICAIFNYAGLFTDN